MTGTYDWNPMPHVLDVRCPSCQGCARFEFAEMVQIHRRDDLQFFRGSQKFEYAFLSGAPGGGRWHGAFYFAGLHGSPSSIIHDLPDGYAAKDWEHSQYLYRQGGHDLGSITCRACRLRKRHELSWPADAYYQFEFRGGVLWAFHRESAQELREYVSSASRKREGYRWRNFLLHVPSKFLSAKSRAAVVKGLERLLRA